MDFIRDLQHYIFNPENSFAQTCAINGLIAIGILQLVSVSLSVLGFLNRHVLRPLTPWNHIVRRYGGKGQWALVTGGTDGIGLEICN
jgi:hypothetical protein